MRLCLQLVNEYTSDTTRRTIEVFVATPHCKVNTPLMKFQWDISNGMSEIPTNDSAFWFSMACNVTDIKKLTCVELNPAEHYQGDAITMLI